MPRDLNLLPGIWIGGRSHLVHKDTDFFKRAHASANFHIVFQAGISTGINHIFISSAILL